MSTAPACPQTTVPGAWWTQEDAGGRPPPSARSKGEGGGLGEEQSPASLASWSVPPDRPLLGWSRALWGKGSDGLGFVFLNKIDMLYCQVFVTGPL